MIIRHDVTAETYCPLPWSPADFSRLKEAFRINAPAVELDCGQTETGEPHISVMIPGVDFEDGSPCITRNERGWQMVRGGDGPLYEFETAQESAEFLGSKGGAFRRSCAFLELSAAGANDPISGACTLS
jgi:hypothetical protein